MRLFGKQGKLSARVGADMAAGRNAKGYLEWFTWALKTYGAPFLYHTKDSTYRADLQRPSNRSDD